MHAYHICYQPSYRFTLRLVFMITIERSVSPSWQFYCQNTCIQTYIHKEGDITNVQLSNHNFFLQKRNLQTIQFLWKFVWNMSSLRSFSKLRLLPAARFYSQKSPTSTPKKGNEINANVPGLSSYVIKQKSEPLGPGASSTGKYKVPEYFSYVFNIFPSFQLKPTIHAFISIHE